MANDEPRRPLKALLEEPLDGRIAQRFTNTFNRFRWGAACQHRPEVKTLQDVFDWMDEFSTVLVEAADRATDKGAELTELRRDIAAVRRVLGTVVSDG